MVESIFTDMKYPISCIQFQHQRLSTSGIKRGFPYGNPKWSLPKKQQRSQKNIMDVRNLGEWKAGVIEGSTLISLSEIPKRACEIKDINNIYVNCRIGVRARLASSILAQQGIPSTIIADKIEVFSAGLKIVAYKCYIQKYGNYKHINQ